MADMVRGGVRKFAYDMNRPTFLKKELAGFVGIGTIRSEFTGEPASDLLL